MDKLNLMNTFVAVVEEGGFTAAANRLGKTKALISTHVSQLETALSVRLVNRSTRRVNPTSDGMAYYHQVKQLLDELATIERQLVEQQSEVVGRLRISAPQTYGEVILPPFLARMLTKYPDLEVDLTLTDRYVDLVSEGFDAVIRLGQLQDSNLVAKTLGAYGIHLCASPELVKNQPPLTHPEQLNQWPCVIDANYRQGKPWLFQVDGESLAVPVPGAIRVNSAQAALKLILSGVGVGISPGFLSQSYIQSGELRVLLTQFHQESLPISVLYPHRQHLQTKVRVFITELKDFLGESSFAPL